MKRAPSTLQALGFSEIEALVYCYLLTNSPATGYRVSRGIGKPVANTYKAIADLKDRGVLDVSNKDKTIARPISPEELLGRLDGEFHRHRNRAAEELAKLSREPDDEHLYRLSTTEEVLSRARAMMDRAQEIILVDAFPAFWDELRPSAVQAQARGVTVLAKLYAPEDLAGMRVFRPRDEARILAMWPGHQLNLVVDALEHLLALASSDLTQIHQAIWSNSAFISCVQYNHLWCEFAATRYFEREESEVAPKDRLTKYTLTTAKPPGIEQLTQRYAGKVDREAQSVELPEAARMLVRARRVRSRVSRKRTRA
jgi:HTH-type transcriptional regulator, sugar sensing transcriptional regulator